jgi:hypothetical protein
VAAPGRNEVAVNRASQRNAFEKSTTRRSGTHRAGGGKREHVAAWGERDEGSAVGGDVQGPPDAPPSIRVLAPGVTNDGSIRHLYREPSGLGDTVPATRAGGDNRTLRIGRLARPPVCFLGSSPTRSHLSIVGGAEVLQISRLRVAIHGRSISAPIA